MVGKFSRFVFGGKLVLLYIPYPSLFLAILHASGSERVREIGLSLNRAVRFLLVTFPLTTGHNMLIDPCLLAPHPPVISPSATEFRTAAWA